MRDENKTKAQLIQEVQDLRQRLSQGQAAASEPVLDYQERRMFRALLETTPDIIVVKDRDSVFQACSQSTYRQAGRSMEEVLGGTDFDLFPHAQAERFRQEEVQVMDTGQPLVAEHLIGTPQGERWMEASKIPLRDETGEIVGVLCVERDITGRKRLEDELRRHRDHLEELVAARTAELRALNTQLQQEVAERRRTEAERDEQRRNLIALLDTTADIVIFKDQHHTFRACSQVIARLLGKTRDELTGKTDFDLWSPADARRFWEEERRVLEDGQDMVSEHLLHTAEGPRWVEAVKRPLRNEEGQIVGLLSTERDITGRKEAEEQLLRNAAQSRMLADISQAFAEVGLAYQDVLDAVVRRIAETVGDVCDIRLLSEDGQWLHPVAIHHVNPEAGEFVRPLLTAEPQRADEGLSGRVIQTGQPVVIPHVPPDQIHSVSRPRLWPYVERFGTHSVIVVPLRAQGRIIGVLAVSRDATSAPYTVEDQTLLQDIADRAGLAIANARLFKAVQQELAERKRAEAERDVQRRMLVALLDTTPDVVIFKDRDSVFLACSESKARQLGKSTAELVGQTDFDLFSLEDARLFRKEETQVMETGQPLVAEHLIETLWGRRWYEAIKTPLWDEAGQVVGVLCTERDITDRKRAEEALRKSEERYRALFNTMLSGFGLHEIICDSSGQPHDYRFLEVNPAFEKITGLKRDQVVGKTVREVLPKTEDFWIETYGRVALTGEPEHFESYTEALGKSFEVLAYCPEPGQFAVTFTDTTERKQLEAQFLQAQKMETVGRLAGGVAHDFNNLLTVIIGYANFAQRALQPNDPIRSDVDQILKSAKRAAEIVKRLLAFSRRQAIAPQSLNLNDLIVDVDKMLRHLIGEDIELVTLPGPDLGRVKADPGLIEQVLTNLVVNARDAMPGGGTLRIETSNVTLDREHVRHYAEVSPGDYVVLTISDTGVGMTDEVKSHLFEPFFTTKEVGKGTGLGLATVYGIVKQHGGHIWVDSAPGQGTTVKVHLPRTEAAPQRLPRTAEGDDLPHGSETVLVVEDEPSVREFTVRILTDLGYNVLEAAHGHEALRLAEEYQDEIQLLLTDVVMPSLGGKELAQRLASLRPTTKVLFVSGYTEDAIAQRGSPGPEGDFLQKPFTVTELAEKVRVVLDSSHSRPS